MNETDIAKLYDILDAITKIEKYYTIDPADELRWNMTLRQLQNIGEAATKLSDAESAVTLLFRGRKLQRRGIYSFTPMTASILPVSRKLCRMMSSH